MTNRNEIAKVILYTIGTTGLIIATLTAPNAVSLFAGLIKNKKYNKTQVRKSYSKLAKNKCISITYENDKTIVRLTKEGKERLLKFKLEDLQIQKPKKWDKKFRLIIFDVPEKFKSHRTEFARRLKEIGFLALQKSVWIHPHPCEDEVDFLKETYEISPYVRIVTAESIDIQSDLINKFNLY